MKNNNLHYNITVCYNENGKNLNDILKEHFFIYLKELQKTKKLNE